MSLLTKASTVTTPTAYSDGLLHSVKPVENLGSELVTNGSFNTDSDWTKGTGWTISGGKANRSGVVVNDYIGQSVNVIAGKKYIISYDRTYISGFGQTNLYSYFINSGSRTTLGNYTDTTQETVTVTDTFTPNFSGDIDLRVYGINDFTGSIDNVTIKEVLGADFDFSRASSATRVNEQGYIEKERENLFKYSNDFSNSYWADNAGSCTRTSGQSGYDGTNDAWLLTQDNITAFDNIVSDGTPVSGIYTFSVYAKANTGNTEFTLRASNTGNRTHFNLTTGAIASNSGVIDSEIVDVGSGWYRCSVTFNASSDKFQIYPQWNYSSAESVYIQDAQLEQGLVATDYIETTTSSVAVGITNDIPRINYEGGNGNFLLEPQRTNIYDNSEYFDDWNSNRLDRTANNVDSPEGVQNAYKMAQQSGFTTAPNINKGGIAAGTYTISIFAKKGSWNYLAISFQGVSYFNLETGSKGTINSNHTATIEDYGNGWYRCAITRTTTTTQTPAFYFAESDNTLTTSDTQGYMYAYGAQAESGSYPTSYIPTFGSTVTRVAETCNNAGNSDLFNDSEGVLYAEISALDNDLTKRNISISDGSTGDVIRIHYHTTSNSIRGQVRVGAAIQTSLTYIVPDIKDFHKVALSYKENDVKLYVDGVLVLTDTTASMPSGISELAFNEGGSGNVFYGKTKMVSTFTEALSDSELECLTSWSSFNRMATAQNYTIE